MRFSTELKAALTALLLATPPLARAGEVDPGRNYFDVVKAVAAMPERAPEHLKSIDALLRDACPESGEGPKACRFPGLARAHAQAYADWKAVADGSNPFALSDVLLRPRWSLEDVRAGQWNVNPDDRERLAQASALTAARFLASGIALERGFAEVAAWMGTWGSPYGAFQPVIRPMIAAFLSSGNPLVQMDTFSREMSCREGQSACLAVKARLGRWLRAKAEEARPLIEGLSAGRFADEPSLREIYQRNLDFRAAMERDWEAVAAKLGKPETLLELPAFAAYVDFLAARAGKRKNLMPGPYSLADEVLATVILADLTRVIAEGGGGGNEGGAELPPISAAGEEAFRKLDASFEKTFAPYARALRALR